METSVKDGKYPGEVLVVCKDGGMKIIVNRVYFQSTGWFVEISCSSTFPETVSGARVYSDLLNAAISIAAKLENEIGSLPEPF